MAKKNYIGLIDAPTNAKSCILIVCPRSHEQSGAKLKATLDAIKARFGACPLFLADTLDVHNRMGDGVSLEQARRMARSYGDTWLEQHRSMLNCFFDDAPDITRWTEITNHSDFAHRYNAIMGLYASNLVARHAINSICYAHTRVQTKRKKKASTALMKNSISYMLEEIAGLSIIHDINPAPEVYPGLYFEDSLIFDRLCAKTQLALPSVYPITFAREQTYEDARAMVMA